MTNRRASETDIRAYRLARVKAQLAVRDLAGILLFDPINIRYATGSRNMQVWTMHNACRYAFVATEGPVVLFDFSAALHLAKDLETIDDCRPAKSWDYGAVGGHAAELAGAWAEEIADLIHSHGGGNRRIALDRADLLPAQALAAEGLTPEDGKAVLEHACAIKSAMEIAAMRDALKVCAESVAAMRDAVAPGARESDMLAILSRENIARGGEYMETRLLTSGPRTNPWFQETADRVMEAGDLLSFDTDLIGPGGFFTDLSRSWLVGDGRPSDEQRRLYDLARQQLEHNSALLRPGLGFLEMTEKAWKMPELYRPNRYADIAHGAGLGVEYPLIYYPEDAAGGAHDGVFEENMIVCVESYIGTVGGREGVKLEQPLLITADGTVPLCDYPFEEDYH